LLLAAWGQIMRLQGMLERREQDILEWSRERSARKPVSHSGASGLNRLFARYGDKR
jgi:hypothetical protein